MPCISLAVSIPSVRSGVHPALYTGDNSAFVTFPVIAAFGVVHALAVTTWALLDGEAAYRRSRFIVGLAAFAWWGAILVIKPPNIDMLRYGLLPSNPGLQQTVGCAARC